MGTVAPRPAASPCDRAIFHSSLLHVPAWITLTVTDLPVAKLAALVDQLGSAALGNDQSNPIPEIIVNVTTRIRTEIAAGGRTTLDADATKIPPSLRSLALRMVLRESQSRLNALGALPLSDDERKEWDQDIRYLERIARREIAVEATDNPESSPTVQASALSPAISASPRGRWGHSAQDGA